MLTFEPTFVDSEDMYYASLMFDDCCTLDASDDLTLRRARLDKADKTEEALFRAEDEDTRKRKRDEVRFVAWCAQRATLTPDAPGGSKRQGNHNGEPGGGRHTLASRSTAPSPRRTHSQEQEAGGRFGCGASQEARQISSIQQRQEKVRRRRRLTAMQSGMRGLERLLEVHVSALKKRVAFLVENKIVAKKIEEALYAVFCSSFIAKEL